MEPSSPFNKSILEGKVALITGGGSGIGLEIATQFGRHGARVAIMGRRRKVLDVATASLTAQSIQVVGFDGDVRKKEDAIHVVECTVAQFGKLDILVNGAAGNFMVPAEHLSQNGFRTVLDIDVVGTFTMCHAALKYLKTNGEGKGPFEGSVILNISATLQYSAAWYQLHVAAAKAAVDSMTRSLALEWGTDYGVRVNGIAPGPIADTLGLSKLDPEGKFQKGLGQKWDIAMAAIYLVSDAGRFLNGTILVVDRGTWFYRPRYISKEAVQKLALSQKKQSTKLGKSRSKL
ncbi:hypothetical protein O6H91_02G094500 [Diphasiastrum complanatum]|uniref:Uncharacterized protein n=1 Tax=Diphasiastrum complanatum TaxID=34168 RepID=A0ACC2EIE5_DIPCM|nr:hypothetical protein O6H91_02G094500 [Diphasiastrum complanatum]